MRRRRSRHLAASTDHRDKQQSVPASRCDEFGRFVSEKISKRQPIASMPGVSQLSLPEIADEASRVCDAGLQAVILFGIPEKKDEQASGAYAEDGIVQKAVRAIKAKCPELIVITD